MEFQSEDSIWGQFISSPSNKSSEEPSTCPLTMALLDSILAFLWKNTVGGSCFENVAHGLLPLLTNGCSRANFHKCVHCTSRKLSVVCLFGFFPHFNFIRDIQNKDCSIIKGCRNFLSHILNQSHIYKNKIHLICCIITKHKFSPWSFYGDLNLYSKKVACDG